MTGPAPSETVRARPRVPRSLAVALGVVGVLVVAGLVAWPLGGWDTVTPTSRRTPDLRVGAEHRGSQFATRIESATIGPAEPDSTAARDGRAALTVTMVAEDLRDDPATSTDLESLLAVAGVDGATPDVHVAADDTGPASLGPGVPTRLTVTWDVADGAFAAGDALRVGVVDRDPASSVLGTGTIWLRARVGAVARLSLGDGPAVRDDGFGL